MKTKTIILALLASSIAIPSFAHHHGCPPPPPSHHHHHDCNLLSGTLGFIGGVFTGIGLCQPKTTTVVVNPSMTYVPPATTALPRVTPSTTTTTVSTSNKDGTTTTQTTTVQTNPNSTLVWVEGYYVQKHRGSFIESTYVPGHWETR